MVRTFAFLVSASLVPLSESGLFTPHPDGCQSGQEYGCAAQLEAVNRLETGQPRNTVAGVTTGKLDCSELYSHEGTWEVDLSATETVTATKNVFVKGHGGFVTWCGDIIGEIGGELCITWKPGNCGAQFFHMSATRGVVGPTQREFETQPGKPVRRRLADGTHVETDDDLAVVEVYREYIDEDQEEGEMRRILEESLDAPELEYLPDGRKASAVDQGIRDIQDWKDGRTQADMFLRLGGRKLRPRTTVYPVPAPAPVVVVPVVPAPAPVVVAPAPTPVVVAPVPAPIPTMDNGSNIDIMVVYTAKAAALAGGEAALRSACATRYAQFATLMKNSNVAMSFTLVGLYQTAYVESTGLSTDLTNLRAGQYLTTGESIASVRTKIGADLVQMLASQPASCGYGYLFGPSSTSSWGASNGFSTVHYGCMGQYSHMHEVGHNMGMTHDVNNAVSAFGYGYGYQMCVTGGYRTLMAYSCSSGVSVARQPVLSSPSVSYMAMTSGTATADNKRVLSETALRISNFYLSVKTAADDTNTEEVEVPPPEGATGAMSYIGCFEDEAADHDLDGGRKYFPELNSPLKCYSFCKGLGFEYFALQNGKTCYCDSTFGSYGKAQGGACDKPCTGDDRYICGGQGANTIYAINY